MPATDKTDRTMTSVTAQEARALEEQHQQRCTDDRARDAPGAAHDHRHPDIEGDERHELLGHDVGDVVRIECAGDAGERRTDHQHLHLELGRILAQRSRR